MKEIEKSIKIAKTQNYPEKNWNQWHLVLGLKGLVLDD